MPCLQDYLYESLRCPPAIDMSLSRVAPGPCFHEVEVTRIGGHNICSCFLGGGLCFVEYYSIILEDRIIRRENAGDVQQENQLTDNTAGNG